MTASQPFHAFDFHGATLHAMASGALHWPAQDLLCVSDLHLGRAARGARFGGAALPPYETRDTLTRLETALNDSKAATVICLGDSFDTMQSAAELEPEAALWIARLQAGRRWIWIEGNHDPGPLDLGGSHLAQLDIGPLTFRHIADPGARAEVSGHYHPKAGLRGRQRPAFLLDEARLILPAFGTYTGGLRAGDAALTALMSPRARAILTGPGTPRLMPMPRPR